MKILYHTTIKSKETGYGNALIGDGRILEEMKRRGHIDHITYTKGKEELTNLPPDYDICILKTHQFEIMNDKGLIPSLRNLAKKVFVPFVWETDPIPKSFIQELLSDNSGIDGFLCPSEFGINLLTKYTKKPVLYFPHSIEGYVPVSPEERAATGKFTVLYMGQYTKRKGVMETVAGFSRSLGIMEDTELIIKYSKVSDKEIDPELEIRSIAALNTTVRHPNIKTIGNMLPVSDLQKLYQYSSLLMFPSRGEGFGLPIAEMMACGGRVAYTNWSASKEVGDSPYNYPIEYNTDEAISMASYGYELGLQYAVPKMNSVISTLITAYNSWKADPIKYYTEATKNVAIINNKYSPASIVTNISDKIMEAFRG